MYITAQVTKILKTTINSRIDNKTKLDKIRKDALSLWVKSLFIINVLNFLLFKICRKRIFLNNGHPEQAKIANPTHRIFRSIESTFSDRKKSSKTNIDKHTQIYTKLHVLRKPCKSIFLLIKFFLKIKNMFSKE